MGRYNKEKVVYHSEMQNEEDQLGMPQNTVLLLYFIAVCARLGAEILRAYKIYSVSQICLTGNINRCLAILGYIFYIHAHKSYTSNLITTLKKNNLEQLHFYI